MHFGDGKIVMQGYFPSAEKRQLLSTDGKVDEAKYTVILKVKTCFMLQITIEAETTFQTKHAAKATIELLGSLAFC